MGRYIPVKEASPEELVRRKERYQRWKKKRLDAGLTAQPYKPRTNEQRARAALLARRRYVSKPRKKPMMRAPDEQWLHRTLIAARHRAKKRSMGFSITKDDLSMPIKCPILGIALEVNNGNATRKNGNSPSIDRIRNMEGYVPGNVRIISARANHLKSDASFEEIEALYKDFLSRQPARKGFAHINQHHIRENAKDGGNRPVVTIKLDGVTRYAREVIFHGETSLKYDGTTLACGARCWIEFDGSVTLIDEMSYAEAKEAA